MILANRVNILSESMTIAIATLARNLKAEGKDVLSFSAGEPDFDTPETIKQSAIAALQKGHTKYTAVEGILEVRKAICAKLQRENNLIYTPNEVIVSVGAKHSLFNLFQAVIDKDDEVIIPSPYWVTYPELVLYSGGKPIFVETQDATQFKMTAQQLKQAITPKTKMIILTSPSNPTGAVYTKEELEEFGEILRGTNIIVASDEMYEKLIYDNQKFTATASISDDMLQRTVTINGLSKSVAMTGWRFGYLASKNKNLIEAMNKLQSQSTSNINSITQYAAITALEGKVDSEIYSMREEFEKRRNRAWELFNKIEGLSVVKPTGAFYLFVNIKNVSHDSMQFCKDLLEQVGVAVVPGIGFGMDGYFRFSFATDLATIEEGINRIKNFITNYKK